MVMQQCNEIEAICNGIYLLREFSDKTRDRILSYGELIASRIISAYFTSAWTAKLLERRAQPDAYRFLFYKSNR
jgi:aspartokinase